DNGGTKAAGDFTMQVTGTRVSPPSLPGSETGTTVTLSPGSYSVNQATPARYAKTPSAGCAGPTPLAPTQTCALTNHYIAQRRTVVKHVVNGSGGTAVAANFTMAVTGTNVSAPSFPGSETGTTVTLNAGAYQVDETTTGGYLKTLGTDCSGTIAVGESRTCVI